MRRIDFCNENNRKAWLASVRRREGLLVGYLIAGDPTPAASAALVGDVVEAGVDVLEIGIPSRLPYLDGDVIRRGHARVVGQLGSGEEWLLAYLADIRGATDSPIWAMGYRQELIDSGLYRRLARMGLIDALVLPDCSADVHDAIQHEVAADGVDVVRFAGQSMTDAELAQACGRAAIVYAQAYAGSTGNPFAQLENLARFSARIERVTPALKVVGFGLRSPERVREAIASGFDGAAVGSAFVVRCEYGERDSLYRLVAEMKEQAGPLAERSGDDDVCSGV